MNVRNRIQSTSEAGLTETLGLPESSRELEDLQILLERRGPVLAGERDKCLAVLGVVAVVLAQFDERKPAQDGRTRTRHAHILARHLADIVRDDQLSLGRGDHGSHFDTRRRFQQRRPALRKRDGRQFRNEQIDRAQGRERQR
jgi:hypothetical protein